MYLLNMTLIFLFLQKFNMMKWIFLAALTFLVMVKCKQNTLCLKPGVLFTRTCKIHVPVCHLLLHSFLVEDAMEMVEDEETACNDKTDDKQDDKQDDKADDKENGKGGGKAGAIYTRWGSHDCPDVKGTKLIYQGKAAASYYNHAGGAVNYICLPDDPDYDPSLIRAGVQGYSKLYGVEYENPAPNNAQQDENAPCVVCLAGGRTSLLMVPAKLHCPEKWTLEYNGFLMSNKNGFQRTMFECVDKGLEGLSGSASNDGGGLFYNVEATCNGIDCPPDDVERELMCAVCTS